jgi:hypothetical protein
MNIEIRCTGFVHRQHSGLVAGTGFVAIPSYTLRQIPAEINICESDASFKIF